MRCELSCVLHVCSDGSRALRGDESGDAGLALKINISIWLCLDFGSVRIHPGSSHLWYLFVESARKKDIIEVNTSPAVATRITNISPW